MVSSRKGLSSYEKKYNTKLPNLYQIRGRRKISKRFKKKRTSFNIIRYSLLLRYNSLQTYRLLIKEFPFPSLYLLKKITEGQLDAVKCTKYLKSQGVISEDIVLMFDEMYLQKCEEYCGGEIIGANENNELRITRIYDHRIKRKCPLN